MQTVWVGGHDAGEADLLVREPGELALAWSAQEAAARVAGAEA